MSRARILVVDDNPAMREAIAVVFGEESDLCICGTAHGLDDAMEQCETLRPDLALIDLSLRGADGLDLVRRIVAGGYPTHPVVFSLHDEPFYIDTAREAGARGYIVKSEDAPLLLAAVRRILAGETRFPDPGPS